jgi:hypothetical protein
MKPILSLNTRLKCHSRLLPSHHHNFRHALFGSTNGISVDTYSSSGPCNKVVVSNHVRRPFASATNDGNIDNNNNNSNSKDSKKQIFNTERLYPGEWDPTPLVSHKKSPLKERDPLYRPPFKSNRAKIISAEDFANRPPVTFEEQFDSLSDGMVILSWLSETERQQIYDDYLKLMVGQHNTCGGITSHEYVMRVLGQKYNLTAMRIAAIVQNCHDEEQAIKDGEQPVHTAVQEFVDAKIREHIRNCYTAYGEQDPMSFIEDPVGVAGGIFGDEQRSGRAGDAVTVEDLVDVDKLSKEAYLRDKDDAQLVLDNKIYIEDVDQDMIKSKVNSECLNLIQQRNQGFNQIQHLFQRDETVGEAPMPTDKHGNIMEERRPRWKFAAKVINKRELKKNGKKSRSGGKPVFNQSISPTNLPSYLRDNTIVEQNGTLRVATVKEVTGTAWKPERNELEFICKGVKDSWIDRVANGTKDGWGRVASTAQQKGAISEQSSS